MQLIVTPRPVHTRHPFRIARGESREFPTVTVTLRDTDGVTGIGEAAPSRFYDETTETVCSALESWRDLLARTDGWSIEAIERAIGVGEARDTAAKAAVSAALHDLAGKRLGVPLWRLWGLEPTVRTHSSFTIAIAPDDAVLAERVREAVAAGYPLLKVKLGSPRDREILAVVRRAAPDVRLRVDANAAWTADDAIAMLPALEAAGVEALEQPCARDDIAGLRRVTARASLPVIADESCRLANDVPRLVGAVDGINIKLAKCGGLREAMRLIAVARAHDLRVMCGCMIESSLGITAAAHLASLLDDADLDGAALLADDPFVGATIDRGVIAVPTGAGLGVVLRDASTGRTVEVAQS
ncbi:MAG: dipeptide epimerase [Gemmatimonadaceae bacterium]|jgi:L-alanine-DL-glutamate epimerase-like enolase superfamily enzyme|nr:dipeptide epimerase [Gemmatimonadaceae bacterium]